MFSQISTHNLLILTCHIEITEPQRNNKFYAFIKIPAQIRKLILILIKYPLGGYKKTAILIWWLTIAIFNSLEVLYLFLCCKSLTKFNLHRFC